MLGIIFADANEKKRFNYHLIDKKQIGQFVFKVFQIHNHNVVVCFSGIGLVNSAAATQTMINNFQVQTIFNYGAVGGDSSLKLYQLIVPHRILYFDAITPWYQFGTIPKEKPFYVNGFVLDHNIDLGSGNSFLSNVKEMEMIKKKQANLLIFDMEAVSIAQICHQNKILFITVKCISDCIGSQEQNFLETINTRIKKASDLAFDQVINLIKTL